MSSCDEPAYTIGIVGNYGGNNNGDEAILMGIISQLLAKDPCTRIVVFSVNPQESQKRYELEAFPATFGVPQARRPTLPNTDLLMRGERISGFLHELKACLREHRVTRILRRYLVNLDTVAMHPCFWIKTYYRLRDLDLLLIGGGNLLMDMFDRAPPLYAMYSLLARLARTKLMYYSVGAGPISTALGRLWIRVGAGLADHITLRDQESRQVLRSIGVNTPMTVAADPALELCSYSLPAKPSDRWQEILSDGRIIGVSLVPFQDRRYWPKPNREGYQDYLTRMASVVDAIVEHFNQDVVLFSTKFPADVYVSRDVHALLRHKDRAVVVQENLDPVELLDLLKRMSCVLGTRLHSVVLAMAAGVPVLAISYHNKIRSLMNSLEQADMVIPLDTVSPSLVCVKLEALLLHYENRRQHLEHRLWELRQMGRRSAEIAFEIMTRRESNV